MTISGGLSLSSGSLAYDAGDRIAVGGALALNSSDYITPIAPLANGTYTLFTYASGTPVASNLAVTGPFFSYRQNYSFDAFQAGPPLS